MLDNLRPMLEGFSVHIEAFADRYDQLLLAARSLTNNNQGQAIDLVHDALIEFVRHSPDLHKINNLDGYLRTLMSNLFKSQKRRMSARSECEVSVENYNSVEGRSAEVADRYCNPHLLLHAQDLLRIICEYACFRKEKLKLGSALILRFFHGYHTSEIAKIMRVTASAVSHQLKLARTEIGLYLDNPKYFRFYNDIAGGRGESRLNYGRLVDDMVDELRRAIFQPPSSRKCILQFRLHKIYSGQCKQEVDCETLAHIVSCVDCLDAINDFLGLESLSMRYPADTLSRRTKAWKICEPKRDEIMIRRAIQQSIQVSYSD